MIEATNRGGTSSGKKMVCTGQAGLVVGVVASASSWTVMEVTVLIGTDEDEGDNGSEDV